MQHGTQTSASIELQGLARVALRALPLARQLWHRLGTVPPVIKQDGSTVTLADYAIQALIVHDLQRTLGARAFLCEESAFQLRNAQRPDIVGALEEFVAAHCGLGSSTTGLLDPAGPAGDEWWLIDPIDGTAGFVAGSHFSICIAQVSGGRAVRSAVASPRLQAQGDLQPLPDGPGCVVMAERGRGAWLASEAPGGLDSAAPDLLRLQRRTPWRPPLRWARSVNRRQQPQRAQPVVEGLGHPVVSMPIDSQCKYALVAMDRADLVVRLPRRDGPEHAWDHVAGALAAEESGALASNLRGEPLRSGTDSLIHPSAGIICAAPELHAALLPHMDRLAGLSSAP